MDSGPALIDWREQLRERVKEIRARKVAASHQVDELELSLDEQAAAATAEKLRAAREQASAAATATEAPEESQAAADAADALAALTGKHDAPDTPPEVSAENEAAADPIAAFQADDEAAVDPIAAFQADDEAAVDPIAAFENRASDDEETRGSALGFVNGSREGRRAEIADLVDSLVGANEDQPSSAPEDPPSATAEEAVVPQLEASATGDDDDTGIPEMDAGDRDTTAAEAGSARPAAGEDAAPPDDVPLFQEEPDVFAEVPRTPTIGFAAALEESNEAKDEDATAADDDELETELSKADDDDAGERPAEAHDLTPTAARPEPTDDIPIWARGPVDEGPSAPAARAPEPDLEAIPTEMQDAEIPAWALPRQPLAPEPPEAPEPAAPPATETTDPPAAGVDPEACETSLKDFYFVAEYAGGEVDATAPEEMPPTVGEMEELPAELDEAGAHIPESDLSTAGASNATPVAEPEVDATAEPAPEPEPEVAATAEPAPEPEPEVAVTAEPALEPEPEVAATAEPAPEPEPEVAAAPEPHPLAALEAEPAAPPDRELSPIEKLRAAALKDKTADRSLPGLFDQAEPRPDAAVTPDPLPAPASGAGEPQPPDPFETFAADKSDPDVEPRLRAAAPPPDPAPHPAADPPLPEAKAAPTDPEPAARATTRDRVPPSIAPASNPMQWDLDAPSDPDVLLDAQRRHLDPSAPVSDRVFSAVADAFVLLTIGLLLSLAGASAARTPVLPFLQAAPIPFVAAWLVFAFGYGIFFVGTCGQTLGKMAMRVRVIGAHTFHVGYPKAAARSLWYAVAALPAFLGLVPALRDPEHRALHDRLSGTRVVKA